MGLGKMGGGKERVYSLAGQKYCLSRNCHSTTINLLPLMFQRTKEIEIHVFGTRLPRYQPEIVGKNVPCK